MHANFLTPTFRRITITLGATLFVCSLANPAVADSKTYRVGPGQAYTSITSAVNAWRSVSHNHDSGLILLTTNTYTQDVQIHGFASTLKIPNLTIKPDTGVGQVTINGGGSKQYGVWIRYAKSLSLSNITFTNFRDHGFLIEGGVENCTITSCQFNNTTGSGSGDACTIPVPQGSGAYVKGGATTNITFNSCTATGNHRDGFGFNSEQYGDRMDTIRLNYCNASSNGRQGVRTQSVYDCDIVGGTFNSNDASGIQIEQNCVDVYINSATANSNGNACGGESGIWVDESRVVTIFGCTTDNNRWNMIVTQSEDVTIQSCWLTNARDDGNQGYGLSVGTGQHWYNVTNNSGRDYTTQPYGGVRRLHVAYCYFSGNDVGDILYEDIERSSNDDENFMRYDDNWVLGGTYSTVTSVPFDLIGGGTGYVTNKLENLSY